jgi:hypothetical protein
LMPLRRTRTALLPSIKIVVAFGHLFLRVNYYLAFRVNLDLANIEPRSKGRP